MFSLIITIIAIALVASLALASVYYGGDAFTEGNAGAAAAQYMNEATQIAGAVELYRVDHTGQYPESPQVLVDTNYLKSVPAGEWTFGADTIVRTGLTYAQCLAANEAVGITEVLECDDVNLQPGTPCCEDPNI